MCKDKSICSAVCRASRYFKSDDGEPVPIIGAPNTIMETVCGDMGIPFIQEIISDLEYDADGNCKIPRAHEPQDLGALQTRLSRALRTGEIECKETGGFVDLKLSAEPLSLCIHSDTPGATEVAAATREVVNEFNRELS